MLSKVYDKKASNSLLCLRTRIAILFFLLFCCVGLLMISSLPISSFCCFPVGAGYFRQSKLQDMLSTRQWSHDHCLVIKVWSY